MWIVDAMNAKSEAAGPSAGGGRIHTWKMENMSLGTSHVDRLLPDLLRSVSRERLAPCPQSRAARLRDVARLGAGILVLRIDPNHGGRYGIHVYSSRSMGKGENPIGVSQIDAHGWIVLAIGFVVSYIVAYASVAWFMAYVRKHGFAPFAVYRIIVGTLVLVFAARLAG